MDQMQAVDHIFENLDEFKAKYAGTIRRFEDMGIDHKTALAKAKALADLAKSL